MLLGQYLVLDVLLLSAAPLILYRVLERLRAYWLTFRASSPTPVVARLLAPIVATYKFTEEEFYGVDGAPADVQAKRRAGLEGLAAKFASLEGPKVRGSQAILWPRRHSRTPCPAPPGCRLRESAGDPHTQPPSLAPFSFFPQARELNEQLRNLSDVRFTDTNRVPHAFQPVVRSKLKLGFIAAESDGPYIIDVDGERRRRGVERAAVKGVASWNGLL
jgi:hypothetical protein